MTHVPGVLDEPFSQLTPAQRSSRTGPPVYIGWNRVPSCVGRRPGFGSPLSWLIAEYGSSKTPLLLGPVDRGGGQPSVNKNSLSPPLTIEPDAF
jgi:hypothetical protein